MHRAGNHIQGLDGFNLFVLGAFDLKKSTREGKKERKQKFNEDVLKYNTPGVIFYIFRFQWFSWYSIDR